MHNYLVFTFKCFILNKIKSLFDYAYLLLLLFVTIQNFEDMICNKVCLMVILKLLRPFLFNFQNDLKNGFNHLKLIYNHMPIGLKSVKLNIKFKLSCGFKELLFISYLRIKFH